MSHISAFQFIRTAYFVGSHEKRDRGLLKPSFLLRTLWRFHKTLAKTGNSDIQSQKQKGKIMQLNKLKKL